MIEVPDGMTPEKLRLIADWFDTYDTVMTAWVRLFPKAQEDRETFVKARDEMLGTEVQDDLRRWAYAIETQTLQEHLLHEATHAVAIVDDPTPAWERSEVSDDRA
jgi:hypothetical protein